MATQTEVTPSLVFSQKGRAISVETALGPDELLLEKFEGEEELSGNFHYTLGLLSKNPGISAAKMIRTPATLRITLGDGGTRTIHGMISRFAQSEQLEGLTVYEAELVPWFSLLAWSSDFCTFQNMSIPDIVRAVCKEQGFTDITMKLVKPHPPHEYRVQYGETHLAFLSRLMEEEGMFTFYEPDGKNLVVADDNSAAKQTVKVRMATLMHETGDDSVLQSFAVTQEVRPGKCTMIDYNFETPSTKLVSETPGKHSVEVVEYPAGFGKREEGDKLARLRHEEEMGESVEAHGTGRCRALRAGVKLELSNHANKAFNGPYLVTSVQQKGKLGEFRSGGDGEFEFSSSFTATPFDTPYRPERSTPAPRAYGYESAVVVGPSGEEIYTDKYGRVKVQFFWDRRGTKDDKSSCWVRVSTLWAGKGFGFIHTPRIGQEVLVAFLNGDPEDPIVVGRVWNAEQMPPYALPANKTQSGVKTRSSMHGTPDNFNEIRFEDKKGSEQLLVHAERNLDIEVEHDETHWVGHDRTKTIDHDETTAVKHDRTETVDNNESITIHGNRTETVDKDETITVTKNRAHSIGEDESLSVTKNRTVTIGKDETITVEGNRTTTVKKNETLKVEKHLVINAAEDITIKTGDASITMKKDGTISIKGKDVTIEGSGKINVKASSDLVLKGSKVSAN